MGKQSIAELLAEQRTLTSQVLAGLELLAAGPSEPIGRAVELRVRIAQELESVSDLRCSERQFNRYNPF